MIPIRILAVASILAFSCSCATVMTGRHDVLSVNSSPSGARFTTNTGVSGVTPAKIEVPDSVDVQFTFEKEGYASGSATANHRMSGWVWGNLLIGGIIGLVVDFASGGINTHSSDVSITLAPAVPNASPAPTTAP